MVVGADGLGHWVQSGNLDGGRHYMPDRSDHHRYDGLADRYLAVWNGTPDDDVVESLYSPDAVVTDTLLGESVAGRAAIHRSVRSDSWPSVGRLSIINLPEGAGRVVYIAPSDDDWMGPEELRLVIEVDDGSGCPGLMAVNLRLDGDRVRWERRYHEIMSVRRCYDPSALQPGWWEGIQIPSPIFVERTGSVSYGDVELEVFNGTPELDGFLEWGFSRYEEAGLPLPHAHSVTFLDARAACYDLNGRANPTEQGMSITLCRTSERICLDDECQNWRARDRQLWLHELAHAWLDE